MTVDYEQSTRVEAEERDCREAEQSLLKIRYELENGAPAPPPTTWV